MTPEQEKGLTAPGVRRVKVLVADTSTWIEEKINAALAEDWVLHGSLGVAKSELGNTYTQLVTKVFPK